MFPTYYRAVPIERVDYTGNHPVPARLDPAIDPAVLDGLLQRAGREVDEGLLPACQIAVAFRGELLASQTYGASPTSRFVIYSCTKAITAGVLWRLLGQGMLERTTRVADVVPSFAEHGKDTVTVEHLLTHTAGFPDARMPDDDWVDRHRRLSAARLVGTRVGARLALRLPRVVGALGAGRARRVGDRYRLSHVRPRCPPRASQDRLALPWARPPRPVRRARCGRCRRRRVRTAELDELGGSIGLDVSAIGTSEEDLLRHNDPEVRAVGHPGGGAVGRAADLAMYYQALLANPAELWQPEVLAAGTADVLCDLSRPHDGRSGQPHAGVAAGRQRRDGDDAGLRLHQLAANVRTHGCRRAGVVGRPGHRIVVRLPDQRAGPEPGAHGRPWPVAVLPSGLGGRSRSSRYMTLEIRDT